MDQNGNKHFLAPVLLSIRAKGLAKYIERGQNVVKGYGITPLRMTDALDQFSLVLNKFDCGATFPITAAVVERNRKAVARYRGQNIEFAIHGYRHVDHSQLTADQLSEQLLAAQTVFSSLGIPAAGFRSPYMQFGDGLAHALEEAGLAYVSNKSVIWDVVPLDSLDVGARNAYERAIEFYQPEKAREEPALPRFYGNLIEIPVSLPDDEMLVDRLDGGRNGLAEEAWSRILDETHERGELFTLLLHPERIGPCSSALSALLSRARAKEPSVWIARMDQIADWWRARSEATVAATEADERLRVTWDGPEGLSVMARNVQVLSPTRKGAGEYEHVESPLVLNTITRPFVGVPEGASEESVLKLRQLGYIVERSDRPEKYSTYLDDLSVSVGNIRSVTSSIENSGQPLVKFSRWPGDNRSALAITGDIDALTIWDYGLRFLGR
jgi:peptidoglycan/xylan/chitin deacetylase (PgdA/CDA1 family)